MSSQGLRKFYKCLIFFRNSLDRGHTFNTFANYSINQDSYLLTISPLIRSSRRERASALRMPFFCVRFILQELSDPRRQFARRMCFNKRNEGNRQGQDRTVFVQAPLAQMASLEVPCGFWMKALEWHVFLNASGGRIHDH